MLIPANVPFGLQSCKYVGEILLKKYLLTWPELVKLFLRNFQNKQVAFEKLERLLD